MKQVHRDLRAGQHPAHRGRVEEHMRSRHRTRPARPGRPAPAQYAAHRRSGPPPAQSPDPGQVGEAVCHRSASAVLPGLLIGAPPGAAAAVLVDAQVATGAGPDPARARGGGERVMAAGQEIPACRAAYRRGDPPVRISFRPAPAAGPSAGRGGTCGTRSVKVLRAQPAHRISSGTDPRTSTGSAARRTSRGRVSTVSCRRAETARQSGHAAAAGNK